MPRRKNNPAWRPRSADTNAPLRCVAAMRDFLLEGEPMVTATPFLPGERRRDHTLCCPTCGRQIDYRTFLDNDVTILNMEPERVETPATLGISGLDDRVDSWLIYLYRLADGYWGAIIRSDDYYDVAVVGFGLRLLKPKIARKLRAMLNDA